MIAAFPSKNALLILTAVACLGAGEYRPAPKFAGKSIPDPPRQQEPWTPPETKLPKFLINATTALFEQGVADPRDCEYREVEISAGMIVKTRGFVLPARPGDAGRFAVTWDGEVCPALSVGAVADLDRDLRTLAESMRRDREAARQTTNPDRNRNAYGFARVNLGGLWGQGGRSGVDGRSPLKLCLLLRLGRADLAEDLFAAGTSWTPAVRDRDLTDYQMSYLTLAADWASLVYIRLVDAHIRSDDVIALDAARRLSAFAKAAGTKADAMGFPKRGLQFEGEGPSNPWMLRQLSALLADHERRAKEPSRGPIPKRGGDPTARVAALIRDLDQINVPQMSSFGGAQPDDSPLVRALIAEGDPAVEPLLTALETDMRLTRTVSYGRGNLLDRSVRPVHEAELAALIGILKTSEFQDSRFRLRPTDRAGRKTLANSLRAFWVKNRNASLIDRWYGILRDDSAGGGRWLEAAGGIVQPSDFEGRPGLIALNFRSVRKAPRAAMKGEPLRARRDPSVSELLTRRISEFAAGTNSPSTPNGELRAACQLALVLERWDPGAALPVHRTLMARCLEASALRQDPSSGTDQELAGMVAGFTLLRASKGDRPALDEYAGWLRTTVPTNRDDRLIAWFEPAWVYPDHPKIAEAVRWLFHDPESPWVPILRAPNRHTTSIFDHQNIYASALLSVSGFRDGLVAALAVTSEMGTVRRSERNSIEYKLTGGVSGSGSFGMDSADLEEVEPGVDLPFRVCDYLASKVAALAGAPRCELYWPEDRRNRAVEASVAFLRRYGDRVRAASSTDQYDSSETRGHLAFPALGRPATLEDVRQGRAIFSLEGEGEAVRVAELPSLPIPARWVTLKDFPINRPKFDGTTERAYDQDGGIWQAEEVRHGDRRERSYGFVGRHVIARVPASEIELGDPKEGFPFHWGQLSSGLDARVQPVEPRNKAYEPDTPVRVALQIRNRRGVENSSPTEFLRRGDDTEPALRRGLTLSVLYTPATLVETHQGQGNLQVALKPKRTEHFDPGDAARPLAAFEGFEAMRLDLNDWFDLTRPGAYNVQLRFEADSGVGEGTVNGWYFRVSPTGGTAP